MPYHHTRNAAHMPRAALLHPGMIPIPLTPTGRCRLGVTKLSDGVLPSRPHQACGATMGVAPYVSYRAYPAVLGAVTAGGQAVGAVLQGAFFSSTE